MGREIEPELNLLQNLLLYIRRDTMQVTLRKFFSVLTDLAVARCIEDTGAMRFIPK